MEYEAFILEQSAGGVGFHASESEDTRKRANAW